MTFGWPDSMTATQELVVPRSIPTTLQQRRGLVLVHARRGESDLPGEVAASIVKEGVGVRSSVFSLSLQKGVEHRSN